MLSCAVSYNSLETILGEGEEVDENLSPLAPFRTCIWSLGFPFASTSCFDLHPLKSDMV